MIIDKEYPATHSMWTSWFAIDEDGNVAIMECDDNGPAPIGAPLETDADELLLESLIDKDYKISYTDEQLSLIMTHSISPEDYISKYGKYADIFGCLCEINPEGLPLLEEAKALRQDNNLICVSKNLNLWYVSFSLPHYLDDSSHSRYRSSKLKVEQNEYARKLYRRLLDERILLRLVDIDWELGYDSEEDEQRDGRIRKSDAPFILYFQEYDAQKPLDRKQMPPSSLCVKEHQLPKTIRAKAIRLPLKFQDSQEIQLGQYVNVRFYGVGIDDWTLDGQPVTVVKFPDGNLYFIGNECHFEPIPLNEAFNAHEVKYTPYYSQSEYCINGQRGYIKVDDGRYRLTGTYDFFKPSDEDTIEIVD